MNMRRDFSALIALRHVRMTGIHSVMLKTTIIAAGNRLGSEMTMAAIDANSQDQNKSEQNPKKHRAPLRMKRAV